jgi:hypothetical protein
MELGRVPSSSSALRRQKSEDEQAKQTIRKIWGDSLEENPYLTESQLERGALIAVQRLFGKEKTSDSDLHDDFVSIYLNAKNQYKVTWQGKTYDAVMKPLPTVVEGLVNDTECPHRVVQTGLITHALYVIPCAAQREKTKDVLPTKTIDGVCPGLVDYDREFASEPCVSTSDSAMNQARENLLKVVRHLKAHREIRTPKKKDPLKESKKNCGYIIGGDVTFTHEDEVEPEPWMTYAKSSIVIDRSTDRFRSGVMAAAEPFLKQHFQKEEDDQQKKSTVAATDESSWGKSPLGMIALYQGATKELEVIQKMIDKENESIMDERNPEIKKSRQHKLGELTRTFDEMRANLHSRMIS